MKEAESKLPIFKKRFNELRGNRTQAEFADFLNISRPTVGFYENGDRIPDALVLKNIAEKCGVSSDWLIGLSEAGNKKGENTEIGQKLGLSDKAIERIEKYNTGILEDNGLQIRERHNVLNAIFEGHTSILRNIEDFLYTDFSQTWVGDKYKVPTRAGIVDAEGNVRHLPPEQLAAVYLVAIQQNLTELKKEVSDNGDDSETGK